MKPIEILLIEDNPGDVLLTQTAFKDGRVMNRLNIVRDGEEALHYLKHQGKYVDSPEPGIILLDLNLPKKDGRQVLKEIKEDERLKKIPVIILTTSESEEDVLQAYENHANCYIRKPVDLDRFMEIVRKIEDFWLSVVKLPGE